MKRVLVLVGGVLVALACARLGVWQLSRLHEKQELNRRLRGALVSAPIDLETADKAAPDALGLIRVAARGTYDETHQFLLMGKAMDGDPGVSVVTPLRPDDGSPAVLVDRGWIPSIDAATAQPERFPARGERTVIGLASPIEKGIALRTKTPYIRVEIDSLAVWSTPRLDADSVAQRLPYAVRPYVLRALPDREDSIEVANMGQFAGPIRWKVKPYDETVHRSYAGQWFAFAVIALVGSIALMRRRPQKA